MSRIEVGGSGAGAGVGDGTSSASAAGAVVSSAVPAGVEFAFWGHYAGNPGALVAAFRVTTPGDYSWANEGDADLVEGFDYATTPGNLDLTAMQVGQYVVISALRDITLALYATKVTGWGFDPGAALPGGWQHTVMPTAAEVPITADANLSVSTNIQAALSELAARVAALEAP